MTSKHVYVFIGTTAELIKLAPVIREFNIRKIPFTIIASGQNDIHFEEHMSILGNVTIIRAVTPKSRESSIIAFLIWTIRTFFSLLLGMRSNFQGLNKSNSLFLVHGDTVSSLMGSLVAFLYGLKLVHIESGLRSFHFFEPFPEEICRYLVSRLADIHFCPNAWCVNNLRLVKGEKIQIGQNTLIDTFWVVMKKKSTHPFVVQMEKQKKRFYVLVVHRQEHVIFGRKRTKEMLKFILSQTPKNLQCIFLVHDLSVNFIRSLEFGIPGELSKKIIKIGRLPYHDFMHLLQRAEFIVTDGGSNQEELYYMGKPCLLLRNYTERIEGLERNVVLSKNDKSHIKHFLQNYHTYKRPSIKIDMSPSKIIVDYLFPQNRVHIVP